VSIAAARGYRPGWLYHTFEARYGRPPTVPELQEARQAPQEPTQVTLKFIMAKHRAYATRVPEQPAEPPPVKVNPAKRKVKKPKAAACLAPGLYIRRGHEHLVDALDYIAGSA